MKYDFEYQYLKKLEDFFNGEVKDMLKWIGNPWEKFGNLDLIKCSTIPKKGFQWSKLPSMLKNESIGKC
ncbi:hypothetical protein [Candidatus Borrarchaeum sp.]|uniref:hypothetical protein n=1 Tax=Candidatus Borrarchaeum sp. TaxID=2846742 RepID=UPI00257D52FD|nr:hypothetical protein [Candidatus Borrarchaeum sp.]